MRSSGQSNYRLIKAKDPCEAEADGGVKRERCKLRECLCHLLKVLCF